METSELNALVPAAVLMAAAVFLAVKSFREGCKKDDETARYWKSVADENAKLKAENSELREALKESQADYPQNKKELIRFFGRDFDDFMAGFEEGKKAMKDFVKSGVYQLMKKDSSQLSSEDDKEEEKEVQGND